MDLKGLNYVVTVANEGSISRAAEKLFMSQSSLSQAIRVLEQDRRTSCLRPHYPRSPANCRRGCFYFPRKADPAAVPRRMQ